MRKMWAFLWYQKFEKKKEFEKIGLGSRFFRNSPRIYRNQFLIDIDMIDVALSQ